MKITYYLKETDKYGNIKIFNQNMTLKKYIIIKIHNITYNYFLLFCFLKGFRCWSKIEVSKIFGMWIYQCWYYRNQYYFDMYDLLLYQHKKSGYNYKSKL